MIYLRNLRTGDRTSVPSLNLRDAKFLKQFLKTGCDFVEVTERDVATLDEEGEPARKPRGRPRKHPPLTPPSRPKPAWVPPPVIHPEDVLAVIQKAGEAGASRPEIREAMPENALTSHVDRALKTLRADGRVVVTGAGVGTRYVTRDVDAPQQASTAAPVAEAVPTPPPAAPDVESVLLAFVKGAGDRGVSGFELLKCAPEGVTKHRIRRARERLLREGAIRIEGTKRSARYRATTR